jgi:hypothetical protein
MRHKLMFSDLLILVLFLLPGRTALASGTWYVNAATGSDSNDCLTPTTACKTIGHAISLASSGDTIQVAAGTYPEVLIVSKSLTIMGAGIKSTIIDNGDAGIGVSVINESSVVQISYFTIQHGDSLTLGGGINNAGSLTLTRSTVTANNSATGGGGVYNTGTMKINSSTISSNITSGSSGGIYNAGSLTLTGSTVTLNNPYGGGGEGGGIYNAGTMTIRATTLSNNSTGSGAVNGAGIYNSGSLTLKNSTISGNGGPNPLGNLGGGVNNGSTGNAALIGDTINTNGSSTATYGAGVYNAGVLTLRNTTINGNSAYNGGGIFVQSGTLNLMSSTVTGSSSYDGGGISIIGGTLTLTDSTVSGNNAAGFGGGVYGTAGTATLKSSTISGNNAIDGGGVANVGNLAVTLQNTVISEGTSGANCYGPGFTSSGYNLSSDGSCPLSSTGDLNNTDPLLGPLQNNGGPTQTQALLAGSPAIDAGNPGPNDGKGTDCPATDQRGHRRTDRCDMGAYEYP